MGNTNTAATNPDTVAPSAVTGTAKYTLFVKIHDSVVLPDHLEEHYRNLSNRYQGDAGVDLPFPVPIQMDSDQLVGLGVQTQMVRGDVDSVDQGIPVSYWMTARSSICKTPLFLANGMGVIDAGYRGELKAALAWRSDKGVPSYPIQAGERLVQIVAPDMGNIRVVLVDQLSDTERSGRGFGSTGK